MKQINDYINESIFDIDDESIVNKKVAKPNIYISQQSKKSFNIQHFTIDDVNYLIQTLFDIATQQDKRVYDILWNFICYATQEPSDDSWCWELKLYEHAGDNANPDKYAFGFINYFPQDKEIMYEENRGNTKFDAVFYKTMMKFNKKVKTDKILQKFLK